MAPQRPPQPLASHRPSGGPAAQGQNRFPPPPGGTRPRVQKPKKSGGGFLRGLIYAGLVVIAIAGAGVGYLIINPPSDLIRRTIAEQIKAKTGRDLIVAGPAAFSFYPGMGVTLKDVSLSGAPGSPAKLVTMAELDVNIKAMPLINREIEVRRLIVRKPVFDLRVDKTGNKNWNFADVADLTRFAQAAPLEGTATDAPVEPVESAPGGIALPKRLSNIKHLQLNDVRIEDGTLRFTDERSGKTQEVNAVNVNLVLPSLQSPVIATGDLAWRGEKIAFDGKLTSARTILEEKPARLVFTAQNEHFSSSYDGNLLIKDGADLEGQITTKSGSVRSLAKWLGTELPPVTGFGPVSLTGTVKTIGNVTSISNANFVLDGATASGGMSVTTGGIRPYVQANLKISELDLNKYMTAAVIGEAKTPAVAPEAKPSVAPTQPPQVDSPAGDPIENLLKAPAGKVYGYEQRAGWSSVPFNMALLGVVDTEAKLQVGRLIFNEIKVGQSAMTVALKNRVLKTTFDDVQLYEGRGTGFLNVDATGKAATIGANFALDGLAAQPFLKDAANMSWLSGKAKVGLQLASVGSNQLQLVEGLNGKADVKFDNGAIVGFNLPGAIRGISQGKFTGLKNAPSEKTDFSEMSATFNIVNGVAQNQDLQLVSPLLRVTGAGTVQLPGRTIDYTVKPKIVASLEGQQGAQALNGLEIPVRISGAWEKPSFDADLKGVLADPNKAVEAVKELSKQFKGKNAGEIVNDLLGKKGGDGATGSTSGATQLLNKFLKPQ